MLRDKLQEKMKQALLAKDELTLATTRLILAALKDRDIAARSKGNRDGIPDDDILSMMQTMIKQRQESIRMYEQGNRPELAAREAGEIRVIETFLPKQLSEDEVKDAIVETIAATGAAGVKDMGRVIAAMKAKYAGQIDFGKASALVREKLSA